MIFQMWKVAWNKLQFKVYQALCASVAYEDKHSTLDPVITGRIQFGVLTSCQWLNEVLTGSQPFTQWYNDWMAIIWKVIQIGNPCIYLINIDSIISLIGGEFI